MRGRILMVLATVLLAVAAHAWYVQANRPVDPYGREIAWLARELALSSEQTERVRAVHAAYCPGMDTLHDELQQQRRAVPDSSRCDAIEEQCARSTAGLISAVSEILTPAQRGRYLELVQPCLRPDVRVNP